MASPDALVKSITDWLDVLASPGEDQGMWFGSDDSDLESVKVELAAAARKVKAFARQSGKGCEPPDGSKTMCSKMLQKCFQKLKKADGDWDGVDVRWRTLYSDVCTIEAVWRCRSTLLHGASQANADNEEDYRGALRLVDLGIIANKGELAGLGRSPSLRSRIASKLHQEALRAMGDNPPTNPCDDAWCARRALPSLERRGSGKRRRSSNLDADDVDREREGLDKWEEPAVSPVTCPQCSAVGRITCVASWKGEELKEHAVGRGVCLPVVGADNEQLSARVAAKQPCLVQGLAELWNATEKWRDLGYIRGIAGLRIVPVEVGGKYNAPGAISRMMRLNDFLNEYVVGGSSEAGPGDGSPAFVTRMSSVCSISDGLVPEGAMGYGETERGAAPAAYLAQHALFEQIPELGDDIEVPWVCSNTGRKRVQKVNVWLGPAGTVSPLHTDRFDNILQQVVGDKYVRIYSPEHSKALRPGAGALSNTSKLDLEGGEAAFGPEGPHADVSALPFSEGILREGHALFIPAGHWHYVRSLSPSLSVNFWWE
mmetsp:Transcript_11648/g.23000  ORF Transcript_11648/g.23000 Transcript_11648/m.23000 type:complete len:542 (+) Transcript_11648:220-1845(+)